MLALRPLRRPTSWYVSSLSAKCSVL